MRTDKGHYFYQMVAYALQSEHENALNAVLMYEDSEIDTHDMSTHYPFNGGDAAYVTANDAYPKRDPLRYKMRRWEKAKNKGIFPMTKRIKRILRK